VVSIAWRPASTGPVAAINANRSPAEVDNKRWAWQGPAKLQPREEMPLDAPLFVFRPYLVTDTPEAGGAFALWEFGIAIYIGRAKNLRAVLMDHVHGRFPCTVSASHYSWRLALDAAALERKALDQFRNLHGAAPRCNDMKRP
jgi:hypothetical protein